MSMFARFRIVALLCAGSLATCVSLAGSELPEHLRDTGLFIAGSDSAIRDQNLPFAPQYPLWSDGANKRRWLYLPPATHIDATDPDAWEFPRGTRLWKEFSLDRRIETRFIERLDNGSWRYASYVWNDAGTDAVLAPEQGAILPGKYVIPSREDCRACHEGAAVPVLGVSALQLSRDRDPLAPHADVISPLDLQALVDRGLIVNLPAGMLAKPPRIEARTPTERAALGYLHGNCGHCHNDAGPLAVVDLSLAQSTSNPHASHERTLRSIIDAPSQFVAGTQSRRVIAGHAESSVLALRMRSRNALLQMPPLGTRDIDPQAIALIEQWINRDLSSLQRHPTDRE